MIDLYFFIALSLYFDHQVSQPGPLAHLVCGNLLLAVLAVRTKHGKKRVGKAGKKVNGLHLVAQFLLTGVFLLDGVSRILALRRPVEAAPAGSWFASIRLPMELASLIAFAEIAAALLMWVPVSVWPVDTLPLAASAVLALLAIAGGIYHMRRKEPAAPNVALFLLAVFVMLGRWRQ